jgi:4-amino-4-deoxy-L-arabinose transferase-like glycosyltransferase
VVARLAPGWIAGAILLLGAAVRLYRLDGRGFWLDEVVTAYSVRLHSLSDVLAYVHFWFDNMPPIFVLTWLLRGLGGSEIAVRLPFALAGGGTLLAVYYLGKALVRPRVGLLAALLMAVLPFAVWYSQEARQYAFLMLFTTLQMLFAYRAVTGGGRWAWIGLSAASVCNLYAGYLALTVTAAAFGYVGLALLIELGVLLRARRAGIAPPDALRQHGGRWGGVALAAAATGGLYWPWLPYLRDYLGRQEWSYTGLPATYQATPADLVRQLEAFDFAGPLLVLLAAGALAGIVWGAHGRWQPVLLLGLWLAVPLAGFWVKVHEVIFVLPVRYFAGLYPALVIGVALGVEGIAVGARWLERRLAARGSGAKPFAGRRWATGLVYAGLTLLLLAQALPALAQSYQRPKDQYREAAAQVLATSGPESVVLVLRPGPDLFVPESLGYYFWLHHSAIVAVEADKLDSQTAVRIAQGHGTVWGMVYTPLTPTEITQAEAAGLEVTRFPGRISLVRVTDAASPLQEAQTLLRWGSAAEPRLQTSAALLQAVSANTLGENLLPGPEAAQGGVPGVVKAGDGPARWVLGPGTAALAADQGMFRLTTAEQEVNITLTTARVAPGKTYLLLFRYRNASLDGSQRVYAAAHNADLAWLDTFPDGLGYLCPRTPDWTRQGFAFTMPAATTAASIWLRATGSGSAEFRDIELRALP